MTFALILLTTFGKLILVKIIKTVATRCHVLKLKCNKLDFGWGSAANTTGGAYSAPPDHVSSSSSNFL